MRAPAEHFVRKGMVLYRFPVSDGKDLLHVTLFNNKFAAAKVRPGEERLLFGTVVRNGRQYEMAAPQLETAGTGQRIRPIYRQTEGLTSRMIETNMAQALRLLDMDLENDPLPPDLRSDHHLATRRYALENIHFPVDGEALAVARRRAGVRGASAASAGAAAPQGPYEGRNRRENRGGLHGGVSGMPALFPHRGAAAGHCRLRGRHAGGLPHEPPGPGGRGQRQNRGGRGGGLHRRARRLGRPP